MNEKRAKIIKLLTDNSEAMFPESPDKIADRIIDIMEDGKFIPPTKEECVDYILKEGIMDTKSVAQINDTAQLFCDYYASVGWIVGKAKKPMQRWRKALNNWCKRDWTKKSNAKSKVEESIKAYMMLQQQKSTL